MAPRNNWSKQEQDDLAPIVAQCSPPIPWSEVTTLHNNSGYNRTPDQVRNHWRKHSRKTNQINMAILDNNANIIKEEELNENVDLAQPMNNMAQNTKRTRMHSDIDSHTTNNPSHKKSRASARSPHSIGCRFHSISTRCTPNPQILSALAKIKTHEKPATLQKLNSLNNSMEEQDASIQNLDIVIQELEGKVLELTQHREVLKAEREKGRVAILKLAGELGKQKREVEILENALAILGERGVGGM